MAVGLLLGLRGLCAAAELTIGETHEGSLAPGDALDESGRFQD